MAYYRRPYNRARFTTEYTPKTDGFTSEAQRGFALRLVADIERAEVPEAEQANLAARIEAIPGLPELLSDNVTDSGEPVWRTVPTRTASVIIDHLKNLAAHVRQYVPVDPALAAVGPHQRSMRTKYSKKCCKCGTATVPGTDWAICRNGSWEAWCAGCAGANPAEQAAKAEAERAAAAAEAARLVAEVATYEAHARSVFTVVGTKIATGNAVRFAVPGDDGALRFYILKAVGHRFTMRQVIGGRAPMPVAPERQRQVLADLAFTGPDGIRRAVVRYGQELGSCGICGRTLTDEESRRTGIGPVCAGRW